MEKINNLKFKRLASQEIGLKVRAFTLVELIVVITILAILATIGFVSFSWYLAWTRDTNRIAQLKAMSDALELYSTKDDLPKPDDFIEVKDWDKVIAYQGYIWKDVLETIWYTESWLDPKDKKYFSYYLTKNKKHFQLMAFLEEKDKDVVALNNFDKANAIDYSERFPKTTGKKLWMLTGKDNTPIQTVPSITASGYIDISDVWDLNLKSFLKWNDYLSGTGTTFAPLEKFASVWGKFCSVTNKSCNNPNDLIIPTNWLISYYSLKDNADDEWGENNWTAENWVSFDWESASFDGDDDYIQTNVRIPTNQEEYSISAWWKIWDDDYNSIISGIYYDGSDDARWIDLSLSYRDFKPYVRIRNDEYHYKIESENEIEQNKWYFISFVKKGEESIKLYLNWKQISEETNITWLDNYSKELVIAWYTDDNPEIEYYYKGNIKNVRIYNRALTEEEVWIIYNKEK